MATDTFLVPLSQAVLDDWAEAKRDNVLQLIDSASSKSDSQRMLNSLLLPMKGLPTRPVFVPNPDGSVSIGTDCEGRTQVLSAPATLESTLELVKNVIQTSVEHQEVTWAHENHEGKRTIPFVPHGVQDKSEYGSIVYRVLEGQPGAWGSGPPMSPKVKQYSPSPLATMTDPVDSDYECIIFGQRTDYRIQFTTKAKTAHEANRIRTWLKNTLGNNLWYFKHSGIQQFLFLKQDSDEYETTSGENFHCRPLEYFVSITQLSWSSLAVLKKLTTTINVTSTT